MSRNTQIIIAFAILHALTSFACRYIGIGDDLLLTLLSMIMTFIICMNHKVSSKFMVVALIVVNFIGLLIGLGLAELFMQFSWAPLLSHTLATLICTSIMGCGINIAAIKYTDKHNGATHDVYGDSLGWFISAFVVAIILRLLAVTIFTGHYDTRTLVIGIIVDYVFSCLAILSIAIILMKRMNLANYRYETLQKQVDTEKEEGYLDQLIIKCGNRMIPVKTTEIAYFYSENKMNHVMLIKGNTYTVENTISDLETKLDPKEFFRVSRGCIIAKKSIVSITSIESGRLAIETTPESENVITVSRARVDDFMSWFK